MYFWRKFLCTLFLRFLCLSQVLAISNPVSVEKFPTGVRNDNNLKLLEFLAPGDVLPIEFHDFPVMDATEGTTPAGPTPGMTCGFQTYEQDSREYLYFPFVRYCHCPENYECTVAGKKNRRSRFFYYTCQYAFRPQDSTMDITETTVFSVSANNSSSSASTISTDSVTASEIETETESAELRDRFGFFSDIHEL